jgi:methyl-accepting chemotaxis protein
MESISVDLRQSLVERLEQLVTMTEETYLSLGRTYPSVVQELQKSIQKSQDLARCFEEPDSKGCDDELGLGRVIQQTRSLIEQQSDEFEKMYRNDESLFQELDRGIESLGKVEQLIDRIKDDSEEMELISLNAMTVALKAGAAGRAFSYITEELKRLSNRTIGLSEDIAGNGERLLETFHDFRGAVREVQSFQEKLFGEFRERLLSGFGSFQTGVDRVVSVVSELSETSQEVRQPVTSVMEELQYQDIIRQSVDHILIALRETEQVVDEEEDREALLDELTFFQRMPELCEQILDYVRGQIAHSLDVFKAGARETENTIDRVERRRQSFVRESVSSAAEANSIHTLFERSADMLQELLGDVSESLRLKNELSQRAHKLLEDVAGLEERFETFSSLVTRFRSVDIASRIEVAKQEVLRRMTSTVEEMTDLTSRIENDVQSALDSTKGFIGSTSETIETYRRVFLEERGQVAHFQKGIEEKFEQLDESKSRLVSAVHGFSVYSASFMDRFRNAREEIEGLAKLLSEIDVVKRQLGELKARADRKMDAALRKFELDSWDIESRRLREIIERFTIFTHKELAAKLGGFDVEEGVESGEITFF